MAAVMHPSKIGSSARSPAHFSRVTRRQSVFASCIIRNCVSPHWRQLTLQLALSVVQSDTVRKDIGRYVERRSGRARLHLVTPAAEPGPDDVALVHAFSNG